VFNFSPLDSRNSCKKLIVAISFMVMLLAAGVAKAATASDALRSAWEAYYNGDYGLMRQIAESGLRTGKDTAVWTELVALSLQDDPIHALDYATKAAELMPTNAHMLATQAYFLSNNPKELVHAMRIALKAESLAPKNARIHAIIGTIDWRGGKLASMGEFEQAINLSRLDFDVNVQASRYYLQTALDEKAARTCNDRLVATFPKSPLVYFMRAETRRKLSDPEGAIKDYTKSIELNPAYLAGYAGRSRILQFMRRFKEAIADYDYLVRTTKYPGFYALRAECYEQLHDYDKAIADFSEAIKAMNGGKEDDQVYDLHALATGDHYRHRWLKRIALYEKTGQYTRAVSDADKVIKAEPTCELALKMRQESLQKLGKNKEALSDLTQLIKISPSAQWYRERADVYAKLNRADDSKADLERAKRLEAL